MRMQEVRATKMVAMLKLSGIKSAEEISLEDACRLWGKVSRAAFHTRAGMDPLSLATWSTRRRRAKITHPGKRGR
jgi:hypothetical protein